MNKVQFKEKVDQWACQLKHAADRLFGSQRPEKEGKAQQAAGDIQAGIGDLKDDNRKEP
ncbi:CsbD family protein [Metapseudomonas lalkuanensis]|uniref:CsbD family protein n=1 Tax=Metapseudomonas lalkuanensis TaxID=2604832 RepID=A0A5J6QLS1_9GAMM|nr:CsbD family protein [Pseudomonas lalkuanensis]QEY62592.1 CsbD family protein [Pseudomonas lalkuanensis]UCO96184.1 CsbD family protein [Pseudomonas lalkuanensis]